MVDSKEEHFLPADFHIDPPEERALVRRIDRVIMPIMAIVYFFQYLDKQSINYAAVFNLSTDLHLSGTDFSWAVSLFYFGQLVSEYPAPYLMSRLHITEFVCIIMCVHTYIEMCLGITQGFGSLAPVRFFLGFTEGAVAPSFMIITSNWYKRSEHPTRVATWVSMFGVSQIIGALMMYGIGGAHVSIATWRVMFLLCGLNVFTGIVFVWLMPTSPATAWFLKERKLAMQRLDFDRMTQDRASFDWGQVKEALTDGRAALYAAMALFITIPTPILKFSSLVINGFGYNPFQTMLVGLPTGAISFVLIWVAGLGPRLCGRNTRALFGIAVSVVPLIGTLLLLLLPTSATWGIVASTWLASGTAAPLGPAVALMASNVKGNTKKSVVSAVFFVFYSVGCTFSPQLWQSGDAPRYYKGCIASTVSWVCLILAFTTHYVTARWSNAKRDRAAASMDEHEQADVRMDSDLTERQDRGFRYSY
ncbi:MFS general substrate transporter [Thozetella sp. PMI_491]|nr:MFS general substrate transporter [Thozetella sp. PMI_491]